MLLVQVLIISVYLNISVYFNINVTLNNEFDE